MKKFVFFGPTFEATDKLFDDIKGRDDMLYTTKPYRSELAYFLLRIHINRLPFLPLKKIWKFIFAVPHADILEEETVFIYGSPWVLFMFKTGFINFLKKKFPHSHHVAYLSDLNFARKLPITQMKKIFDAMYIFDQNTANEMGISYYPLVCSMEHDDTCDIPASDIVFVGQAKGRQERLYKIYNICSQNGIICDFQLTEVPKSEQLFGPGIKYIDKAIPASESIKHIMASKIVLELKADDSDAFTDRVSKAIVYDKMILTDNQEIKKTKYYNPLKVSIFTSPEDIDVDFLKSKNSFSYSYDGELSPALLLSDILKTLEKRLTDHI